jgi:hypothetical protein
MPSIKPRSLNHDARVAAAGSRWAQFGSLAMQTPATG